MVLLKTIHKRGANIVVEANGEVLFAPTGDVGQWTGRFSRKVKDFSASFAPENKRPRWAHYGKPLKTTFTASTRFQPGRMKVYSAVGSTSPHAWYVDQGTGVFGGSGPYQAKILPPWTRGSASLYEHTWRPGGPPNPMVKPVMIQGQKGQGFFDKGLKRGFQFMRMRSFQLPAEGRITQAMNSFPTGLANFVGNTPADTAFLASLTEWRAWRDAAFVRGEELGRQHRPGRTRAMVRARRAAAAAAQSKAQSNLAASKHAAEVRANAQRQKLIEEKQRRDDARRERAERQRIADLNDARRRAEIAAQKFANQDYTDVRVRTIKNAAGTAYIGYDVLYVDTTGHAHVKHFR